MADPEHVPEMDGFDRMTVRLYRTGLWVAAIALGVATAAHADAWRADTFTGMGGGDALRGAWLAVAVGMALSAANMHIYDKRFRWFIPGTAWLGVLLLAGGLGFAVPPGAPSFVFCLGLGFVYVALSAYALKERLCFKIFGMRFVPMLLAASVFAVWLNVPRLSALLHGAAALLYLWLAISKLRMPLHFDVGNKSHYQV